MVFHGEEVSRSVLRNRVMKEDNLQIIYLTKPESKLKARKGWKWRGNLIDRLERCSENQVNCSMLFAKTVIAKHQNQNGRPERVGNGEEVSRSVRKNRAMKEGNLQKRISDKAKIKMKCRKAVY